MFLISDILKPVELRGKLEKYDTRGSIHITTTADDDGTSYTCETKHPSVSIDKPMRATTKLSVFCKLNLPTLSYNTLISIFYTSKTNSTK